MDGGLEVEEGRVCHRLPARISAEQANATFPKLGPGLAVLPAQRLESEVAAERGHPRCLKMWLVVQRARDHSDDLAQSISSSRFGFERVVGDQGSVFPLGAGSLDLLFAKQLGG